MRGAPGRPARRQRVQASPAENAREGRRGEGGGKEGGREGGRICGGEDRTRAAPLQHKLCFCNIGCADRSVMVYHHDCNLD